MKQSKGNTFFQILLSAFFIACLAQIYFMVQVIMCITRINIEKWKFIIKIWSNFLKDWRTVIHEISLLRGGKNENGNTGIKSMLVKPPTGTKISKINVFSYNFVLSGSPLASWIQSLRSLRPRSINSKSEPFALKRLLCQAGRGADRDTMSPLRSSSLWNHSLEGDQKVI